MLRIVFVGLIAFAQVGEHEGYMLLVKPMPESVPESVPELAMHQPLIIQLDGSCRGDCKWPSDFNQYGCGKDQLCWSPEGADVQLRRPYEELSVDRTALTQNVPRYVTGRSVEWLPSVAAMTLGPVTLRRACRNRALNCPIWTRFKIDSGDLSTCHFLHRKGACHEEDSGKKYCDMPLYDVGERTGAVGNAFALDVEVGDQSVVLWGHKLNDPSERAEASLSPDDDGKITLVVINEPPAGSLSDEPPTRLGHHVAFNELVDPMISVLASWSDEVPTWDGAAERRGYVGSCEDELEAIRVRRGAALLPSWPHGGSECDAATIP